MALSLVVTVAGLEGLIGYVSSCAAAYKYCHRLISSMANIGKDAQYLEDQFYIENARFSAWQILHGLVQENQARSKPPVASQFCIHEVRQAVIRVLGNIQKVFDEIEKLGPKFGLQVNVEDIQKAEQQKIDKLGGSLTLAGPNTSLKSPAVIAELGRESKRQQTVKKDVRVKMKFKWAAQDFMQLQQHVKSLSGYNDQLDKFTLPQALQVAQEVLIKLLPMPSHSETLETRISSMEGYKSVSSASSDMKAAIDGRIAAWRADATESKLTNYEIPSERIPSFAELETAQTGDRTIVTYDTSNGRCEVLLEWKTYNPAQILASDQIRRINAVAHTLRAAPVGSAVLRAAGYVESSRQEGLGSRVALLYELPPSKFPEAGRTPKIQTLRQLLTRPESSGSQGWRRKQFPKPPLGQRFKLAAQIAVALGCIQNCGWLHKGMRPENIVFIGQRDIEIEDPYILGWAYSRRNAAEEQTEAIFSTMQDMKLYHHPDYLKGERYCEAFDHYQLGCLLVEIAHWRLLADIKSTIGPTLKDEDWSDKLVQHAVELKQDMGDIYSSVMARLFQGLDMDNADGGFWFDVVWKLKECRA